MKITYAFCTYNRSARLPALVAALRAQHFPAPAELLAIDNNSSDDTPAVLAALADAPGIPLRAVCEKAQGIVHARNRALQEALDSDILIFIDDDELPDPGLVAAVHHAITVEGARCVGGHIGVDYTPNARPVWMSDELQAFLGEVDYGREAFWVTDDSHPLWSGNIAYDMSLFRDDPSLRFDLRYNRAGLGVGGGEDAMMFRELLRRGTPIRYRPDMSIRHLVDDWKLKRRYFLHLHYLAGRRFGEHILDIESRAFFGIPPFMFRQFIEHCIRWLAITGLGWRGNMRQAMNASHALGSLVGCARRYRAKNQ